MTDLEMVRECAAAMGWRTKTVASDDVTCIYAQCDVEPKPDWYEYNPLANDAQAMALVKRFELNIGPDIQAVENAATSGWAVADYDGSGEVFNADLNRAIVECVAKTQR